MRFPVKGGFRHPKVTHRCTHEKLKRNKSVVTERKHTVGTWPDSRSSQCAKARFQSDISTEKT